MTYIFCFFALGWIHHLTLWQRGYAGGRVPFGYSCQRHTKQLIINESEAKAVRELFLLAVTHPDMTYREMAGILAAHGYTGRNGKPFSVSLAYNILQRADFYLFGRYSYAGIEVIGRHPPLFPIPMETTSEPKNMNRDVSGRDGEGWFWFQKQNGVWCVPDKAQWG